MKLTLQKLTGHIPDGNYQGYIVEQSVSDDGKYLWIKIEIEGMPELFNTSIATSSLLFHIFCRDFDTANNEIETEDFMNVMVAFTVKDHIIYGQTYSKIVSLRAILEDESNMED